MVTTNLQEAEVGTLPRTYRTWLAVVVLVLRVVWSEVR